MHLLCRSPRAYLRQVWSPDWDGGDPGSVPIVRMFDAQSAEHADCPNENLSQGDIWMFSVEMPAGLTSFELVATASVDKCGRVRNIWSDRIDVELRFNN